MFFSKIACRIYPLTFFLFHVHVRHFSFGAKPRESTSKRLSTLLSRLRSTEADAHINHDTHSPLISHINPQQISFPSTTPINAPRLRLPHKPILRILNHNTHPLCPRLGQIRAIHPSLQRLHRRLVQKKTKQQRHVTAAPCNSLSSAFPSPYPRPLTNNSLADQRPRPRRFFHLQLHRLPQNHRLNVHIRLHRQ